MASLTSARSMRLFEAKLAKESGGCWLWTGATWLGYGRLMRGTTTHKAHRFAYEVYIGPIPDGAHVLHTCDVPSCCNPEHLFLGDHATNMQDREEKGRVRHPRGERHGGAKLTREQVLEIRRRATGGEGQKRIAADLGVTRATVSRIVRREAWRHL